MKSLALEAPISRGRVWVPPAPGIIARVVSIRPILALVAVWAYSPSLHSYNDRVTQRLNLTITIKGVSHYQYLRK